ncbi:hypothetical protein CONPUDRAFT_85179 [Coniophora puteana RWD-64-598 SS2]|uniref:Methyltransferase n=1 Tax=Coniophora puteana (strain RWD-64-598) TaxID=741705 RepID=A0A5M3MBF5_CONPW|nr:uncharacterized protein CONPUDRAFT_85179 [Coniophora puteana RWD-64-598 SS2]EIW75965.1 hypothetical protein CONPUDRAFT_85179 [Coniophora puteana RWD-64-598 SS2]
MSTIATDLNYYGLPEDGSRPYTKANADPVTGKFDRNYTYDSHPVTVHNIREIFDEESAAGKQTSYNLDVSGFQFHKGPTKHCSFKTSEEIEKEYYPECIEYFKKLSGASRVFIFDHTVRRRRPGEADDSPERRQPVSLVHVDQTLKSSIARVHRHLPEEAPELLKRRFQVVNLWRPIDNTAWDWPLGLCDFRSIDQAKDLIPVALVYPDKEGETFGVTYNPDHKWKYVKGMTQDELVLIKCFDSIQDGSVAHLTPHTAFEDKSAPADAPLRSSIEVRGILFFDE